MSVCPLCLTHMHLSCLTISCDCNQASHQIDNVLKDTSQESLRVPIEGDNEDGEVTDSARYLGRNVETSRSGKRDAVLKDQQSTGRKRASKLYPLDREAPCEWQNKANCGGGTAPIRGCLSGKQQARHHGPDKSVVNNEHGNVHRICHYCHYRWHGVNDPDYDWNETERIAHSPRPMTDKERGEAVLDEMRYKVTSKAKKKTED